MEAERRADGPDSGWLVLDDHLRTGRLGPTVSLENALNAHLRLLVFGLLLGASTLGSCSDEADGSAPAVPSATAATVAVTVRPSASSAATESTPTIRPAVSASPASCPPAIPAATCSAAVEVVARVGRGELAAIVAEGQPTKYTCAAGSLPSAQFSSLCQGAAAGEIRDGYPFALHGSEGGPMAPPLLLSRLSGPLTNAKVASIGCPTGDASCKTFVVAFATGAQPSAAYLALALDSSNRARLTGGGLSGDNAETILKGGLTMSIIGETRFTVR